MEISNDRAGSPIQEQAGAEQHADLSHKSADKLDRSIYSERKNGTPHVADASREIPRHEVSPHNNIANKSAPAVDISQ